MYSLKECFMSFEGCSKNLWHISRIFAMRLSSKYSNVSITFMSVKHFSIWINDFVAYWQIHIFLFQSMLHLCRSRRSYVTRKIFLTTTSIEYAHFEFRTSLCTMWSFHPLENYRDSLESKHWFLTILPKNVSKFFSINSHLYPSFRHWSLLLLTSWWIEITSTVEYFDYLHWNIANSRW